MYTFEKTIECLPAPLQKNLYKVTNGNFDSLEELRLYVGKPAVILFEGRLIKLEYVMKNEAMQSTMNAFVRYSYHTFEDSIAKGFITLDGGHRIGICGQVVEKNGQITMLRNISSINIRHARQIFGCSDLLINKIFQNGVLQNTLLVSPPGCGKTTMMRDLVRNLSAMKYKVAICDERSELAAMRDCKSSYNLGDYVDVIDGTGKNQAISMFIRAMSPNVVVTDEIGGKDDFEALKLCCRSGVSLLSSMHGKNFDDIGKYTQLFSRVIVLTRNPSPGTVKEIICI